VLIIFLVFCVVFLVGFVFLHFKCLCLLTT
jgi:hypothetical protein